MRAKGMAVSFLALFLALSCLTSNGVARDGYEPGQIIVKFFPQMGEIEVGKRGEVITLGIPSLDQRLEKYGVHNVHGLFPHKRSELGRIYQFDFDTQYDAKGVAHAFAGDDCILYAEPRYRHRPCEAPNDTFYQTGVQWYIEQVDGPKAWNITHGDSTVIIGIVDTGVDWDHPDLWDNIWVNIAEYLGDDFFDDDNNGYIDDVYGWDFGSSGSGYQDNNPAEFAPIHGTHIAGIASAVTDNNTGVAGMSWNCTIMPVKVCEDGLDDFAYGYEGIQYAADNGAQVINLAWVRGDVPSAFEQEIIDSAFAKGAILVAAAGNDPGVTPPNTCSLSYPACYEHVTAVAATDIYDQAASWTYYGDWVDVSAPGQGIYNTWFDDNYAMLDGTSRSCAIVSGIAGLIKTEKPELNSDEFEVLMQTTSDDIDSLSPGYENRLGGGRVNAHRALESIVSVEEKQIETNTLPKTFALHQNYPNPFNAGTEIRYQIPKDGHVILKIFNTLGQELRILLDVHQKAGEYGVVWDGRDTRGHEVASGLYFCRLRAGEFGKTVKMVLLR